MASGCLITSFIDVQFLQVRKRLNQMFHHLLKIMAVYDFVVVVGCGLLYSLPKLPVFSPYSQHVFPVILPWLLPIVQVSISSTFV